MGDNFSYIGAEEQYVIPMGAIGIRVLAWGGHGGAAATPSAGGFVDVTLDATQLLGPNLTVFVGQDGQQPVGGDGNTVGNGGNGTGNGWGGGAASYVKDSNGTYLAIGAGGGGDATPVNGASKGGAGGAVSGNGAPGQTNNFPPASIPGGGGGTQVSGGTGGSYFENTGQPGGSLGTGINVGGAAGGTGSPDGSGGGGGGFYGGGGGGGGFSPFFNSSAGGGGSNYHDAAKTLILDANTSDLRAEADGFVTIIPIFAPCVAQGTKVRLQNSERKLIEDLREGDILAGNIPLQAMIRFTTPARNFVRIPGVKNSEALLIRRGHPMLMDGKEVLPEALIGQMGIEEISTERPVTIYTLVTDKKKFVEMQDGLFVATWSKGSWENKVTENNCNISTFHKF